MSQIQFTYSWDITKFETTAKVGTFTDAITRIYWTLTGSDDQGNSASLYDNTAITPAWILANGGQFIPFKNMSKEQGIELLETVLGEAEITKLTDNLKIQIQQLEATKITAHAPPWIR